MEKIITKFALAFVILAIILLAATGNLLSSSPVVIVVQLAAIGISIWARRSFPSGAFRVDAAPAAGGVIRRGPYRLIRHPMYAATLLFIWAAVLSHLSPFTLLVGGIVTIIVALRIMLEERVLRAHYLDYAAYVQKTKMVLPYLL